MKEISNRIIKTELVDWKSLQWLQNKNLKEMMTESFERLKNSLRNNSFILPFNIWQQNGKSWILDGHHRQRAMEELIKEGCSIPDRLPANFIQCVDRKEAVKLVLVYSSIYANVTSEGLYEMMSLEGLDFDELKVEIDLPEIKWEQFRVAFFDTGNYGSNNPNEEWKGMPEIGDTMRGFRMLIIHFETQHDVDNFSEFIGQKIGEKTKYIWYPQKIKDES